MKYDTEHLTVEELQAITMACWQHYMSRLENGPDASDPLDADPDELSEEYQGWAKALEERIATQKVEG